jgi:hypothetical protein
VAEWTGQPLASHRDQDAIRWLILRGAAQRALGGQRGRAQANLDPVPGKSVETRSVESGATDPAAFRALFGGRK